MAILIRYVGNFRESFTTETHLANTLEQLGHHVIRLQEGECKVVGKCDLFLLTRTWGTSVTLDHLRQYQKMIIPTVSYHLDLYVGLSRETNMQNDPFWATDFVFTPDGNLTSQKFFEDHGINHFYMKPGVYEDECYLLDRPKTHDIVFVGSVMGYHQEWKYREQLINWLKQNYTGKFEWWGPQGLGQVRGYALNELYASTKIVIGDSLSLPGNEYYWSDRVPETLGRGGFLIHPFIKGLAEDYQDKHDLVFYEYGDFNGLRDKIDFYLSATKEREKIRLQGHELVKNNYTYTHRLNTMLKIISDSRKV